MKLIEPIKFNGKTLDLLDQRKLPDEVCYVSCKTHEEVAKCISDMVVRGAPIIGIAAAYGITLCIDENNKDVSKARQAFYDAKFCLEQARPTAKNIFFALGSMEACFNLSIRRKNNKNNFKIRDALIKKAREIHDEEIRTNEIISEQGASLLKHDSVVITHCNAGSLATGGIGTALGVIKKAYTLGKIRKVYVDETRPLCQGSRLSAFELMDENIPFEIIVDSAAAYFILSGKINAVLVGADRITSNGDTANKIGTLMLAHIAHNAKIPFYVCAPASTFDFQISDGSSIPIEFREKSEVLNIGKTKIAPNGAYAVNPAFDVTPANLITAFITEAGIISPPFNEFL